MYKRKLKFSFSSQKRNKPEVSAIKNNGAMARQKKKVTLKIPPEKVLEAERVK